MHHHNAASVVASLSSIGDFARETVEFTTGRGFFITMLVMAVYAGIYNLSIMWAAAPGERYRLFWERVSRRDPFTLFYILICIAFLALPFAVISHSTSVH